MVGDDTATMFESSMINEVVSKSPRRAPGPFASTIEEATISLVPAGVRKPLDLAESQTTRDLGFGSPMSSRASEKPIRLRTQPSSEISQIA